MVSFYLKTGQGIPDFIRTKIGSDPIDDLVNDGLIKIVRRRFNHLPDDVTLCLTGVYCVEDDIHTNLKPLDYIRLYMGVDPVIEIADFKVTRNDFIRDPECMKGYHEWLTENREMLANIWKLKPMEGEDIGINDESIAYLKAREWYEKNDKVSVCLDKLLKANDSYNKRIPLIEELIVLLKSSNRINEMQEYSAELEDTKAKIKMRGRIEKWLRNQDQKATIQSII